MRLLFVAPLALVVSECGARVDARHKYEQSTAAYRECLNANSANPQVCDGKRLAMEADERAFNNMTAPLSRGVGTENINVQSFRRDETAGLRLKRLSPMNCSCLYRLFPSGRNDIGPVLGKLRDDRPIEI
jgi:hypothetical protein